MADMRNAVLELGMFDRAEQQTFGLDRTDP